MEISAPAIDRLETERTRLVGYCYRLLGSAADAEDAAQETLIRAATHWHTYDETRAAVATWVHRIATNVCLDMLRGARRRALLVDVASAERSRPGLGPPSPSDRWVEPMPAPRLIDDGDPADVAAARASIRLAFIAALQYLPPRQRAVLVLRDVMEFSALETAAVLETTVPSVTSALQRARRSLAARRPGLLDLAEPTDPDQRQLLERYVAAFEAHDVAGLTSLLAEDAVASMPPYSWRLDGGRMIAAVVTAGEACATDRLLPCEINGAPGLGQYRPDDAGVPRPLALIAMDTAGGLIHRIVTFLDTGHRFAEFGLPPTVPHR